MPTNKLDPALIAEVQALHDEGRTKSPERVIVDFVPPRDGLGPRYKLEGSDQEFLRLNSNSYLSLSHHPELIRAADEATHRFGVGPGAVRFIDGTFSQHVSLENRIAAFTGKPAAKIFNSAYTANLGLALSLAGPTTYWIGDELNHNCIIRGMRIANVPRSNRSIFQHNDVTHLKELLESVPSEMKRVVIIFDGIFSMRGDVTPLADIQKLAETYHDRFPEGVITVMDDSHGIGAFGKTGRGTEEHSETAADIIVGTFGKAFGVNGGFIVGSPAVIEIVRQKADTYIYTNPLSVADCAAAEASVSIVDGPEGRERLDGLRQRIAQFRSGVDAIGLESIDGPHPVVPVLVRDTLKVRQHVSALFEKGLLVVGLTFPVVPKGDETIRFQINAAHTEADIDAALKALREVAG